MAEKTVYIIKKSVRGFSYYLKLYGDTDQHARWEGLINNATQFDVRVRATNVIDNELVTDDDLDIIPHTILTT